MWAETRKNNNNYHHLVSALDSARACFLIACNIRRSPCMDQQTQKTCILASAGLFAGALAYKLWTSPQPAVKVQPTEPSKAQAKRDISGARPLVRVLFVSV
jgi:hypothetical protein